MERAKVRRGYRWWHPLSLIGVAAMACASLLVAPGTASADRLVQGCHHATCVDAYTGAKNYSNRTQWVGYVDVYNTGAPNSLQVWSYNVYQEHRGGSYHRFWVGRWIPTGNYVCGAAVFNGFRQIACIAIRV